MFVFPLKSSPLYTRSRSDKHKLNHVTPLFKILQRILSSFRITSKLLYVVYKTLHALAAGCLSSHLKSRAYLEINNPFTLNAFQYFETSMLSLSFALTS